MRSRSLFLLAAFVLLAPLSAGSEELADAEAIAKHLELFGYTVERTPDAVRATHPEYANFQVKSLRGGTLFVTFIATEAEAKTAAKRKELLEWVNDLNNNSVLVNFFVDKDSDLGASAWYPGPYEKSTFDALVDRWNSDIKESLQRDPERSRALIQ